MKSKVVIILLLLIGWGTTGSTPADQQPFPQQYFDPPMRIPLLLSGNFGEIRPNHFHAGLDIKTNGEEGVPIYSAAGGSVSRIKISSFGYGKTLYVEHPNGYTTVYAHLQRFSPEIEAYVRQAQYRKSSFDIELFPPYGKLPIGRGQMIAWSGNTGSSGGPHLHFEIRSTGKQIPINPLLFGFDIRDDIAPTIKHVAVYPLDDTSTVNGKNQPAYFKTIKQGGQTYGLSSSLPIKVRGVVGFGIEVIDHFNGSNNRTGAYAISLRLDSTVVYQHEMEKIPFPESRYINAHVDYEEVKRRRRRVQRSFLLPHNRLSIYRALKENGALMVSEKTHRVEYHVKDASGNAVVLPFEVQMDSVVRASAQKDRSNWIPYDREKTVQGDHIQLQLPAFSLYESVPLQMKKEGEIYHVLDAQTPLHRPVQIMLLHPTLSGENRDKWVVARVDEQGKQLSSYVPEWPNADGWAKFSTKVAGRFKFLEDKIEPKVYGINVSEGKDMSDLSQLKIHLSDQLAGLSSYKMTINDQWVLAEYDHKQDRLSYEFDTTRLQPGLQRLKLLAYDKVKNAAFFQVNFLWAPQSEGEAEH